MTRSAEQLRADALAIWRAGVNAVDSEQLVRQHIIVDGAWLTVADERTRLDEIRQIVIIGAGKAGAGMAAGAIAGLGDEICRTKQVRGWLNVPDDCVRPLPFITLHGARPAGINEPTERGVEGAEQILQLVSSLTQQDLCICLLSGGGSALLPSPVQSVPLAEKVALTKALSSAGANIQQLNTVRKQLSRIKGGRLAAACRAGQLHVLIVSDVIGDPLDVIASGPTVPDTSTPKDALHVLRELKVDEHIAPHAFAYLRHQAGASQAGSQTFPCRVHNEIIGNNAVAVDGAGIEAERRGYRHAMLAARELEGPAEEVGRHLARMALTMRSEAGTDCLITGGEPTVRLVPPEQRGVGGRNQQLVLAALEYLQAQAKPDERLCHDLALLSGGTDGEDGPTDAAGAFIDEPLAAAASTSGLSASDFLARNDAYHFFEPLEGLIKTGPTDTNVCDVRVVVVNRSGD